MLTLPSNRIAWLWIYFAFAFVPMSGLQSQTAIVTPSNPADSIQKRVVILSDSIARAIVDSSIRRQTKDYIDILERTNNQLSLWWNPYGVMVGVLGVLFSIGAIGGTVILFRQSREHKEVIRASIDEYSELLDKFVTEKTNELLSSKQQLEATIRERTTALEKSNGDDQAKLESEIQNMKERHAELLGSIEAQRSLFPRQSRRHSRGTESGLTAAAQPHCVHCGAVLNPLARTTANPLGNIIECSQCHQKTMLVGAQIS